MAAAKSKAVVKKKKRVDDGRAKALAAEINATLKLRNPVLLGNDPYFTIERIPTGSLVLDRLIGGGFALGRHYELYGSENSGKSSIVYMSMALSQQRGNLCAMVDPEHSFDNERFKFLGGDPSSLLMFWPETAEDAISVMMLLARHAKDQTLEIIGIDSVASLVTTEESEKDPRDVDRVASQARMMSKALRRITTVNKKTLFLWTNQQRVDVGVKFGNPNTTSGGKALRYYATGRIEFQRGTKLVRKENIAKAGKLVETEVPYARWTQLRVEKEKSTRPLRQGAFVFNYDLRTIDPAYEVIQLGLEDEIIHRTATGDYSYEDIDGKVWKGKEKKFTDMLRSNEDLLEEIVAVIIDNTHEQEIV